MNKNDVLVEDLSRGVERMRSKRLIVALLSTACVLLSSAVTPAADSAQPETISVFGEGQLEVPVAFKRVQPKSRIVKHEFQAKAGEGDDAATARVTLMGASGEIAKNIKRWKDQFSAGDPDAQKTEETKLGQWTVYIVDVNGNYGEPVRGGGPFAGGRVVQREGYAMTGAILVNPAGRKYFAKLIGPEAVVKANREAFVKMVKSIEP
jgi:hypothetical protein